MKSNKLRIKLNSGRIRSILGKILLLTALMLSSASEIFSQPPPPPPPTNIPIDGGLGWLIAAGIAFGAKKSFDFNKKNKKS